jgi:hypothetical protein
MNGDVDAVGLLNQVAEVGEANAKVRYQLNKNCLHSRHRLKSLATLELRNSSFT